MYNISKHLNKIGFDKWFIEEKLPKGSEDFDIARVIAVGKDSYTISNGEVVQYYMPLIMAIYPPRDTRTT
jgi:hypothetical protein